MDGLTLLRRAQDAGLTVEAEGDTLVIRGPKRAESVARLLLDHKPDVLAALAPIAAPDRAAFDTQAGEPERWRKRYAARIVHWFNCGQRRRPEAERVAYGEMILEWHRQQGTRPDPDRCAGCGGDLPEDGGLVIDRDGTRVHFDGVRRDDCIIAYGASWRGAAVAGLQTLGLYPPGGFDLLWASRSFARQGPPC